MNKFDLILSDSLYHPEDKKDFMDYILGNKIVFDLKELKNSFRTEANERELVFLFERLLEINPDYCIKLAKSSINAEKMLVGEVREPLGLHKLLEKGKEDFVKTVFLLAPNAESLDTEQ
jgi:hypothetical protein